MTAIRLVSVQPDFFCIGNPDNNIGGPFCDRCARGIDKPAGQGGMVFWCYYCGFDTGALPPVEVPLGWSDFPHAITFAEAQRLKAPGFDPLADLASRHAPYE